MDIQQRTRVGTPSHLVPAMMRRQQVNSSKKIIKEPIASRGLMRFGFWGAEVQASFHGNSMLFTLNFRGCRGNNDVGTVPTKFMVDVLTPPGKHISAWSWMCSWAKMAGRLQGGPQDVVPQVAPSCKPAHSCWSLCVDSGYDSSLKMFQLWKHFLAEFWTQKKNTKDIINAWVSDESTWINNAGHR